MNKFLRFFKGRRVLTFILIVIMLAVMLLLFLRVEILSLADK
jgi:hypothetical protein